MIWITTRTLDYKEQARSCWHKWFAWHPVCVHEYPDGARKRVWLQTIERLGKLNTDPECGTWWYYKYRLPIRRRTI